MTTPRDISTATLDLEGYSIIQQLYLGSRTAVYRALQTVTQRSVVIKVLQREYPCFSELVQFRNQYAINKQLPISGLVQPLGLEQVGNGYALVMEDWGGVALGKYIEQRALNLIEVLAIAVQLATILHDLHQHRVIHKDIKPANILIHPELKQVKLIDFSIASLLPKETQEIQNPNLLEGTLAYLAPEQTGRMNRGIDYRADFYALGVTLYQLLTGHLPFEVDDPLDLVYCHIAKIPRPVDQVNPAVPRMVAAIVAKLMAKNAEDRYQSGLGLRHDLQQCLTQWQETGAIAEFQLAERDLSDRFLIPEKLYGRDGDVQILLDAFVRVSQGQTETMLVAGISGIGKTAVINEVHKPIVQHRGYFIKGKFDQLNRNVPFRAFVQAFRELVGQLLSESDTALQLWRTQILEALGDSAQVIIHLIPELERILGPQPPAPELAGTAAQNRFNLLFQRFIQVFATAEHPLVIFVDDLQWADLASLSLIQMLMAESQPGYLLLLGAYRDHEVFPTHPLMLTLDRIQKSRATISTVTLYPLSVTSLNQLIADAFHVQPPVVQPLTELVMQKTQGNAFFTIQFLKALHQDQVITFDREAGHWQCDLVQVRDATLSDDIVEFMALQLQKLSVETQNILKLAACIGNQFDLKTLAIVAEQSETDAATALWEALQAGLVLPVSATYKFFQLHDANACDRELIVPYKFLHDRVQQAAYALIPEDSRDLTHYQVGQLLLQQVPAEAIEEQIFSLVNQLNHGIELIDNPVKRHHLAQLNCSACRKAKASTAYQAAQDYATTALSLLSPTSWQDDYPLSLSLYKLAAEVAFLCTDFERMDQYMAAVIDQAKTFLEQVSVYVLKIQALTFQNQLLEAISMGRSILQQLGVPFPDTPTPEDGQQVIREVEELIHSGTIVGACDPAGNPSMVRTIADIFHLPPMVKPEIIAMIEITSSITPACHILSSPVYPLVVTLQTKLSILHGNSPASAFSYAAYGVFLLRLGQVNAATQFGRLAYRLVSETSARTTFPETIVPIGLFLHHRQAPLRESLTMLQLGYQLSLETGKLEQLGYCGYGLCMNAYWCGEPLADLEFQARIYRQQLLDLHQTTNANYCGIVWESAVALAGNPTNAPLAFTHPAAEATLVAEAIAADNWLRLFIFYLHRAMYWFLLGELPRATADIQQTRPYVEKVAGTICKAGCYFYDSLITLTQIGELADQNLTDQVNASLQHVDQNQLQLHHWAMDAPMNYLHKWQLVEAERYRILGDRVQALLYYDEAIAGANINHYPQEASLAHELAAKFYLDWGKEKVAAGYMQEAYYGYGLWGATAKVAHLEREYPQLLRPILHQVKTTGDVLTPLMTVTAPRPSLHANPQPRSSSASLNQTLDFVSILRTSQTLSSTIQLDELLHQLTQIILQNSGGDRCALILPSHSGAWQVRAIATLEETQLYTESLENNPNLPVKLIQYVKNTQEVVVIDDLNTDLPVVDSYFQQRQPKSVLCLPILNQGHLIGILYLKNRTTSGIFTSDRILMLNLLCTQAAISLENARLYDHLKQNELYLEQQVKERTHALEVANQKLEQLAKVDGLTQVANRRCFDESLEQEWQRHLRHQSPLGLLFIDIDYFKHYNDHYGHQMGDTCLIQVAQTLATALERSSDLLARYGGEEFVALLPHTTLQGVLQVAGRMQAAIATLAIPHARSSIRAIVTLSLGAHSIIPDCETNIQTFICQTDQALYRAKELGRNRCLSYRAL